MSAIVRKAILKRHYNLREYLSKTLGEMEERDLQRAELLQRLLFRRTAEALIDGKRNLSNLKKPSRGMKVTKKNGRIESISYTTEQSSINSSRQNRVDELRRRVAEKKLSRKRAIELIMKDRELSLLATPSRLAKIHRNIKQRYSSQRRKKLR